jgi:hypothetical protein
MSRQEINTGGSANDNSGDPIRLAFEKCNNNFTELYTLTGGTSTALTELAQDYAAPLFNHASHTNITVTYDDANNKILLTGTPAQIQTDWTAVSGLGVVLNKPALFSGSYTDLTSKPTIPSAYTLPTASALVLGGIKIGTGLSIDGSGVVTASSGSVSSLVNGARTVSLGSDGNLTFADAFGTFFGSGFLQSGTSGVNVGIKSWDGRQKVYVNETNVTIQTVSNSSQAYNWTFGTDGSLTFPNATVQNTAYIAPTTGNSAIDSINQSTISRNGMTIRVTSAGMIQMSFNSVIGITGRSSINNADSVVIASPNGATVISTWYNIGAVLAVGDHLTATIVDASFHRIYRLTVTMRDKTTGPDSATAYAIIEQIQ